MILTWSNRAISLQPRGFKLILHQETEKVGASVPTDHSEAAPDPQAETESTQGGVDAEQQSGGQDDQNQGQSADAAG